MNAVLKPIDSERIKRRFSSIELVPFEEKFSESAFGVARGIHAHSLYCDLPLDWEKTKRQFTAPNRYFRLAVQKGQVLGGLLGCLIPVFFCEVRVADTIGWWVSPQARGSAAAVVLLLDFEAWAREQGAKFCTVGQSGVEDHERTGKLFRHCGYRFTGFNAVKEL